MSPPLKRYRDKRDFDKTPEPAGTGAATDPAAGAGAKTRKGAKHATRAPAKRTAPRFVIHEHSATRLHWDLRLERDDVLASWAVPKGLPVAPKENHLAVWTEDHPLEYVDFHGEIPEGQYGAGTMKIWDHGTYEVLKWQPRKIEVALHGERVDARYALFAIADGDDPKQWMIHRMDPPADAAREPMPEHVKPMLARAGKLPSDERGWVYEIKWDGVRALAYSSPGELRLESRNLNDITQQYPELARLNRALSSHAAILDGEIVAFDEHGRPSFAALQRRMHVGSAAQAKRLAKDSPVIYMIFDLLWLDGHSTMTLAYEQRRELLSALALDGAAWQTPEQLTGSGKDMLAATAKQQLEGILAKRVDSTYEPGIRSAAWVKIKNVGRQELVIGGWLPGEGRRSQRIGALLVGVYEADGAFRYAGRVGTGFSDAELDRLAKLLKPLRRERSPFTAGERPPRGSVFCKPKLVAEIEFTAWTAAGSLRHPSYKGLRDDKQAAEVVREDGAPLAPANRPSKDAITAAKLTIDEQSAAKATTTVEGRELKLSNLDKLLYPQERFAKRDVIDFYAAVADSMLAHLRGRALTVKRWPDGVEGKSFFQKQAPAHRPEWVKTVTLPSEKKPIDYLLAEDRATLVWLANLAALELHTPLALADMTERPTALVFDLDPGEPATIVQCCRVALTLQGMFENLGLQSFAKTSGKKGLQLYLPLNGPDVAFAQTKPFAKAVAELLEQSEPQLVVSTQTKARRTGKVLIDWSQNDSRKTTVCVYSLRATPRPTVSTPVTWDEVRETLDSGDPHTLAFDAAQVLRRIDERGDLFAPVLSLVQQLPAL
ncbi:MAG TPA: DNA ligase D [Solirubrobacteraceae bacterium]|jgi:bifunctional non-homologous end joining protein LigD|nr:DNA ligase D [Solirubrobacteraceae bacterium]